MKTYLLACLIALGFALPSHAAAPSRDIHVGTWQGTGQVWSAAGEPLAHYTLEITRTRVDGHTLAMASRVFLPAGAVVTQHQTLTEGPGGGFEVAMEGGSGRIVRLDDGHYEMVVTLDDGTTVLGSVDMDADDTLRIAKVVMHGNKVGQFAREILTRQN